MQHAQLQRVMVRGMYETPQHSVIITDVGGNPRSEYATDGGDGGVVMDRVEEVVDSRSGCKASSEVSAAAAQQRVTKHPEQA